MNRASVMHTSMPAARVNPALREWSAVPLFCLLTALLAQAKVPVPGTAVPMTLQTLGVLLTGLFLSPLPAAATMLGYVGLGVAGLGVFSPGSAGLALSSLTGGYLVGFIAAAPLTAWIAGHRGSVLRMIPACAGGTAVILATGTAWLILVSPRLGVAAAVEAGVLPFLFGGAIKSGAAVALVSSIRRGRRLVRQASRNSNFG